MTTMIIRNLDGDLKTLLCARAAQHRKSMEEEARRILRAALRAEPLSGRALLDSIRATVGPYGGIDLELPPSELQRDPPDFS